MTTTFEPRLGRESNAEVAWLALAAVAWLRHLDAALPAAAPARDRATPDAPALVLLGAIALLRRAQGWVEAETTLPAPASPVRSVPQQGDWLR